MHETGGQGRMSSVDSSSATSIGADLGLYSHRQRYPFRRSSLQKRLRRHYRVEGALVVGGRQPVNGRRNLILLPIQSGPSKMNIRIAKASLLHSEIYMDHLSPDVCLARGPYADAGMQSAKSSRKLSDEIL